MRASFLGLLAIGSVAAAGCSAASDAAAVVGETTPAELSADTRLFPAEVGRSWTYASEQFFAGTTSTTTSTTSITGTAVVDGRTVFTLTFGSGSDDLYAYVDGDDVSFRSTALASWMQTTRAPVEEGATWTYSYGGTRKQTWHRATPQTVPAGTFDDCWRIDYWVEESSTRDDVNFSVICRGVGTVSLEMRLANGFSLRQELVARSF